MKNLTIPTDFFNDERIIAISSEFGIEGELSAIKLLCEIYRNGYYLEWNTLKQNFYARTFGIATDVLCRIVNRLAEYGFFNRHMLEKESILTNEDAQRRYFRPKSRRRDISNIPYLIITLVQSEDTVKEKNISTQEAGSIAINHDEDQVSSRAINESSNPVISANPNGNAPITKQPREQMRPNKIHGIKIKYVDRRKRR